MKTSFPHLLAGFAAFLLALSFPPCLLAVPLSPPGTVVAWGDNRGGQTSVPAGLGNVVQIAASGYHSLALKSDGTVVAWGGYDAPAGLNNVVQIAAGSGYNLALKNDGTVVGWGDNGSGQSGVPAGLSSVVQIAAGAFHSLALQSDGTVAAWGNNFYGQTSVPAGLAGVAQIAAGGPHSLALKNDGTVVAWGDNRFGQCTVPAGLGNVVQIAAGGYHSLALKSDGTVVVWGRNDVGQSIVPAGLGNVVQIAAGDSHSLALRSDGTVVAWGLNIFGESNVPVGLSNVMQIAAGYNHSLAITASLSDGLVAYYPFNGNANDASSNSNNGTVIGAVLTTDRFGTLNSAYDFNGTSSRIIAPDSNSLRLTGDFSVAAWIKPRSPVFSDIVTKHSAGGDPDGGWAFRINPVPDFEATPYFDPQVNSGLGVTANIWQHLLFTYHRATGQWRYYINGSETASGTRAYAILNTNLPLLIGCEGHPSFDPPYHWFFDGAIDDIRIYNRVLFASEVAVLADYVTPSISTVSPSPVPGSNSAQPFTITGVNFNSFCTVTLRDRRTGLPYPNRSKISQTSTSITLNPNFGAVAATWSVEVINPGALSTGEFSFEVQAPLNLPEITSLGLATITAGSTPQTLTLDGHDFGPGSKVTVRSLMTGEVFEIVANFVDSTRMFLSTIFSHAGKWSVTTQRSDGQVSQPKIFSVTEDTEFRLSFPLLAGDPDGNKGAYKAGINTIFDHKMGKALENGSYGITTFCGDECNTQGMFAIEYHGYPLYNYLPFPLLLSQTVNYLRTNDCAYDNHAGIDYDGRNGETPVYAAAGGVLEIKPDNGGAGNQIRIKHEGSKYTTGYLHLNRFAEGLKERVVEGQFIGFVGNTGLKLPGNQGQHLHFEVREVRSPGPDFFYDPYGWTGPPGGDPYTALTGLVNETLWRDQPSHPIYVFPVAFAGGLDSSVSQQVSNPAIPATGGQRMISLNTASESYTTTLATDASSWLAIISGGSGSGQATLSLNISPNSGGKRTGKIIIQPSAGGQRVLTVVQEAAAVTSSSGLATQMMSGSAKTANEITAQILLNPSSQEIVTELKRAAQEHQIPANILAVVAYVGSAWQQFDGGGNPFVGADGRIGIMQIDTQNPSVSMDASRVGFDWRYNIEIGCQVLRQAWRNRLGDSLSPYDDENDADPAILENWFHPVAWQRGEGAAASVFVGSVWSAIKSPQAPVSDYFAAVSDLGDPRKLTGFPQTIASSIPQPAIANLATANPSVLVACGKSTLMILRLADQQIHRWNWDGTGSIASPVVNISESIRTEPPMINYESWASFLDEFSNGALADIDGDGVVNLLECALGGDPNDSNSKPTPIVSRNGTNLEMVAKVSTNIAGLALDVESSADCLSWTSANVTPTVVLKDALSQTLKWVIPASGPTRFVRLRAMAQ